MKSSCNSYFQTVSLAALLAVTGGCASTSSSSLVAPSGSDRLQASITWLSDCSEQAKQLFSLDIYKDDSYVYRGGEFTKVQSEERFRDKSFRVNSLPIPRRSTESAADYAASFDPERYCLRVKRPQLGEDHMIVSSDSRAGKAIASRARGLKHLTGLLCPMRMAFGGVGSTALGGYCTESYLFVLVIREKGSCDREIYVYEDGTVHELVDIRAPGHGQSDGPFYEDRYAHTTPAAIARILENVREMTTTRVEACEHCEPFTFRQDPTEVNQIVGMLEEAANIRLKNDDESRLGRCTSSGRGSRIGGLSGE